MKIDNYITKLKSKSKGSFLTSLFRKQLLNSFNKIKIGKINVLERNNKYSFGDKNSDLRVNVEIFNNNFYYLVGKNGLIGATEAYTCLLYTSPSPRD